MKKVITCPMTGRRGFWQGKYWIPETSPKPWPMIQTNPNFDPANKNCKGLGEKRE